MREFSNHVVLSMSDSTTAVSSKYTQVLSVQIVFFTFSCKWFLCFYLWAVIWSYIVDLFAALHELASASTRTLLKLASPVRALLKPYWATLIQFFRDLVARATIACHTSVFVARAKMTQVTSRSNGNHFNTWKSLNLFGIFSYSFKLVRTCIQA